MGRKIFKLILAMGVAALTTCSFTWAEEKVEIIARVMDPDNGYDEYIIKSSGDEILFAEIESDIYQTEGRKGGTTSGGCSDSSHTDDTYTDSCGGSTSESGGGTTGGGCSDSSHTDDSHDDSSGTGDMCLQVLDPEGKKICWAGRPSRPGWQRDPRLACPLPDGFEDSEFTIRVFQGKCGNDNMADVIIDQEKPVVYLLKLKIIK